MQKRRRFHWVFLYVVCIALGFAPRVHLRRTILQDVLSCSYLGPFVMRCNFYHTSRVENVLWGLKMESKEEPYEHLMNRWSTLELKVTLYNASGFRILSCPVTETNVSSHAKTKDGYLWIESPSLSSNINALYERDDFGYFEIQSTGKNILPGTLLVRIYGVHSVPLSFESVVRTIKNTCKESK